MAKKARSTRPESRELSVADLQKAIIKIDRRLNDLKTFDVNTITDRFDAKVTALEEKINSTIADIFGHDTVEYRRYDIRDLVDLPMIIG